MFWARKRVFTEVLNSRRAYETGFCGEGTPHEPIVRPFMHKAVYHSTLKRFLREKKTPTFSLKPCVFYSVL